MHSTPQHLPTFQDVIAAAQRLKGHARVTPLVAFVLEHPESRSVCALPYSLAVITKGSPGVCSQSAGELWAHGSSLDELPSRLPRVTPALIEESTYMELRALERHFCACTLGDLLCGPTP